MILDKEREVTEGEVIVYNQDGIVAAYNTYEGRYFAHLEIDKLTREVLEVLVHLLVKHSAELGEDFFAVVLSEHHRKFLEIVGFEPTEEIAFISTDLLPHSIYTWRASRWV